MIAVVKNAPSKTCTVEDGTVIVLEDDPLVQSLLKRQLTAIGYEVVATTDASAFLSEVMCQETRFAAAVIDVNLPGLSGDQVYSWIRESESRALQELPVIFLTGYPEKVPSDLLAPNKNCLLLSKPHSLVALRDSLAEIMAHQ
ncbi:MAG: response regulator [Pseudomonadota bacterium]